MEARKGDLLFAPFQCDCCWFQKFHFRNPTNAPLDKMELEVIRRANLDIFWSRSSSTVEGLQRDFVQSKEISEQFGWEVSTSVMGPWPMRDDCGFATVLSMLWKSLQKGNNSKSFQQYNTIRKMRTVARNIHDGSLSGHVQAFTFSDARKKTSHLEFLVSYV